MTMGRISWILVGVLTLLPQAHAASFDCSKAATNVEKTICADDKLSQLDSDLAVAYKQAVERSDDKQKIVQGQRQWLREVRDVCADASCLTQAYTARLREMRAEPASSATTNSGTSAVPAPSDALTISSHGDKRDGDSLKQYQPVLTSSAVLDQVSVKCDPAAHSVIVSPSYSSPDDEPFHGVLGAASSPDFVLDDYGAEGRCRWKDGTDVLVRTGLGDNEQSGLLWSAWVNRSKWVDKSIPSGLSLQDGDVVSRVTIGPTGMTTCTMHVPEAGHTSDEACTAAKKDKIPARPDLIEFPAPGRERPQAYTALVTHSTNGELCQRMLGPFGTGGRDPDRRGNRAQSLSGVTALVQGEAVVALTRPYNFDLDVGPGLFKLLTGYFFSVPEKADLDNSGKSKWVLSTHTDDQTSGADVYYVYRDSDLKNLGGAQVTLGDLWRYAEFVYPWSWLECTKGKSREEVLASGSCLTDSEMPFSATDHDGNVVRFRSQYLRMLPFSYKGSTYFLLTTLDGWAQHIGFVIHPEPEGKYEVTCTLESVRPYL